MIALQKEWKTIGSVARKHSGCRLEAIHGLHHFRTEEQECIFQKSVEQTNLAAKKTFDRKDQQQPD